MTTKKPAALELNSTGTAGKVVDTASVDVALRGDINNIDQSWQKIKPRGARG